jgi:PPOX class probable F420-dependent enzyme
VSEAWVDAALASAPVARLATTGPDGRVHLVPVCFALAAGVVVSAVDHKPKRTVRLQRLRDIEATGRATLLVDHYDDDWTRLWWIRVAGRAQVHERGSDVDVAARRALVAKYRQYAEREPAGPVYAVTLDEVTAWRADQAGLGGGQAASGTA